MKKVLKKIINVIIDIVVILVLVVSVLIVTLSLTSKSSGVPNIFGIAPLSVQTDSMEDTINVGDLIFSDVTNDPSYEYQKGDIVTFPITVNGESVLNTHRIVRLLRMTTLPTTEHRVTIRKPTPSPIRIFKPLRLLLPSTQVRRLAAWVTF